MSRDIRSFFKTVPQNKATTSSTNSKNKRSHIYSDDEDIIQSTPPPPRLKKSTKKKIIVDSDSDDDTNKKRQKTASKSDGLSKASSTDVETYFSEFSKGPVRQTEVLKKTTKSQQEGKKDGKDEKKKAKIQLNNKNESQEAKVHNETDFSRTLMVLDDDLIAENVDLLDKAFDEAISKKSPLKKSPSNKKRPRDNLSEEKNTPKKTKLEHIDSGIDPDQERSEKKRYSAMLYQKYLNRGAPKLLNQKVHPEGKANCLNSLCFMKTGVLESLDSEAFDNLISKHGGRTVKAVSKKVNYVVVGDDPGPSKLAKAQDYNIPKITENDLLDMILIKSGMKPKYCLNTVKSEDLGIELDENSFSKPESFNSTTEQFETNDTKKNTKQLKESKQQIIKKDFIKSENKLNTSPKKDTNNLKQSPEKKKLLKKPKVQNLKPVQKPKIEINSTSLSFVEKYKPKDVKEIIGQQGDSSCMNKLKKWLKNWHANQNPAKHKSIIKPSPWAKNDDGAYFKCALLSGPPGIGKTTTATLVAKELGMDIVEFNASDTRNKKLLHEHVAQLLKSQCISGFVSGTYHTDKNRVLIMDEVDGMSGNEDRGGMQELIALIKDSKIPVICICNDRNNQKLRSLSNYCFDLRFTKPRLEQIRGAIMSICFKENIEIPINALTEIISGTQCDVRQTLNNISMWSVTNKAINVEMAKKDAEMAKKDVVLGNWEVCRTTLTTNLKIAEKAKLFFHDYSMGPLFIQENYLKTAPTGNVKDFLKKAALAAESISKGDIIERKIRSTNNWSLLEYQAYFSSAIPGHYMTSNSIKQIDFPGWFGKNSKRTKFKRLLSEIHCHTRTIVSGNKLSIMLDYLTPLRNAILTPLKKNGMNGINESVKIMEIYHLLREDLDYLVELGIHKKNNLFASVDSKVKTAFTKTYNKTCSLLPYAPKKISSKKNSSNDDLIVDEDVNQGSENEDENIDEDILIKKKKDSTKLKKVTAGPTKRTDSKKGKGKGK